MALASLEITRKMKRKDSEAYQRLVKRLFCIELDEDFQESDFIYEPESPRKDSTGCFTGIKRAKSQESLEITESRVNALYQVIEYLGLEGNVTEEGIFRKSGSLKKQQDLMERIDKGEEINFVDGDFTTHECASVLKTFLGNLSEPLVTNSCYLAHLQVALLSDKHGQEDQAAVVKKQIFCTQLLLELIPEEYFKLLKDLLFLLHGVSQREDQNKMSSSNLGIMFSTHILCPKSMSPEELQSKLGLFTKAATFLIENPSILFTLPEKLLGEVQSCRKRLAKRRSQEGPGMERLVTNTDKCYPDPSLSEAESLWYGTQGEKRALPGDPQKCQADLLATQYKSAGCDRPHPHAGEHQHDQDDRLEAKEHQRMLSEDAKELVTTPMTNMVANKPKKIPSPRCLSEAKDPKLNSSHDSQPTMLELKADVQNLILMFEPAQNLKEIPKKRGSELGGRRIGGKKLGGLIGQPMLLKGECLEEWANLTLKHS